MLPIKNIGQVPLQFDGFVMNVYGIRYTDRVTTHVQQVTSATLTLHTLGEARGTAARARSPDCLPAVPRRCTAW